MNSSSDGYIRSTTRLLAAGMLTALLIPVLALSQSPAKVNLLSAGNFEIIASQTITSTGFTVINGDVALSPGSAMTGFPPGVVTGTKHITDPIAALAQTDLVIAYNDAAGRTTNMITVAGNIGGRTLAPGLYKSQTSLAISSGDLTLDGGGDANAVWIFQIGSTLTTTSGRQVILAGGAQAKNIFWQVGSSATLGTGSVFYGTILAWVSVTLTTSTQMVGRCFAHTGAVTCGSYGGTHPDSLKPNTPIFTPIFNTASHVVDFGSVHVDSTAWMLITIANTGTANLTITSATSANAAFSSHLSGTTIPPGGSITDSIKFLPRTQGADSANLIFVHNAATSPDTIHVRGRGGSAMFSTANRNVDVGTTAVGTPKWTAIVLTNSGNDTLRISSATSSSVAFSSSLAQTFIAPGASIIDSILFLPNAKGADSAKLVFISNATTSPDTIAVHGIGGAATFATSLRNVDLGSTTLGVPAWKVITISNTGNDTLRITAATSTNFRFSSHLSSYIVAPGASVSDSILFLPATVGRDAGTLIFASNSSTSPDTISVHGIGTSAIIGFSSRSVNCGTTQVGIQKWTLISISNTGTESLHMISATSTNAVFSSHLSGVDIAPGASITDSIGYLPTEVGDDAGQLRFASNASTSIDAITVFGSAVNIANTAIFATLRRNVNCGTTRVGTPTYTVIQLFNTGNIALTFTSASSSNTVFSSRLSAQSIAPGASIMDTIMFLPTATGHTLGNLLFSTNAINSPDTIFVDGTGTPPAGVNDDLALSASTFGELFPNPVSNEARLHLQLVSGEIVLDAGLYNVLGREMQNWTSRVTPNGDAAFQVGNVPRGGYFVRVRTTQRTLVLPLLLIK